MANVEYQIWMEQCIVWQHQIQLEWEIEKQINPETAASQSRQHFSQNCCAFVPECASITS